MTLLIQYPKQTKKTNEDFIERKDRELTNLDWAKWGGWFDTDGLFHKSQKKNGSYEAQVALKLKDRQPVELFSKTFETSLTYHEWKTITPERGRMKEKEYLATVYKTQLSGPKARWFTKNVFPYLIKGEKRDFAAHLLGYRPESKDFATWTTDEITHYFATAIEGDGWVGCRSGKTTKYIESKIKSSDIQYLSDIKYITENKLGLVSRLDEESTYKTQKGIKTMYRLTFGCSRRKSENLPVFKNLIKDNVMTLDRKKQKIQEFVNYIS